MGWMDKQNKAMCGLSCPLPPCMQSPCLCVWYVVYVVAADLCSTLRPQLCVRRRSHIHTGPHRRSVHRNNSPAGLPGAAAAAKCDGGHSALLWLECPCLVKKVKTKHAYNITRDGRCQARVPAARHTTHPAHQTTTTTCLSPPRQPGRCVTARSQTPPQQHTRHP